MKETFMLFRVVSILITSISAQTAIAQSWNTSGNSNVTGSSKLGTTNLVSLKFFTNNSQRMIIDSIGRVGIGTAKPVNILTVKSGGGTPAASWLNGLSSPVFAGFGETVSIEFLLAGASNSAGNRAVFQGRRSRGTLAAPTVVVNNDYITSLLASAYDGSTFQNPALVSFFVDGTPSPGNVPTRISFVTGSNAGNRTERLKVGSTGNFDFNNGQVYIQQSNGSVGIGTTSPQNKFHVDGTGSLARFGTGTTSTTNNYWYTGNDVGSYIEQRGNTTTSGSDKIRIQSSKSGNVVDYSQFIIDPNNVFSFLSKGTGNGNVGIGTNTPGTYKLKISYDDDASLKGLDIENTSTVNGGSRGDWEIYTSPLNFVTESTGDLEFLFNGSFKALIYGTDGKLYSISDERLKTNIKPMSNMLEKIRQLKPSTYQFKNTTDKQEYNGFIAQDVMKIFPNLVVHIVNPKRKLDVYTMDYSGFGVLAIKGIQELTPIVEEQKEKIATLEERINKLEAALETLTTNKNQKMVARQ